MAHGKLPITRATRARENIKVHSSGICMRESTHDLDKLDFSMVGALPLSAGAPPDKPTVSGGFRSRMPCIKPVVRYGGSNRPIRSGAT